MILSPTHVADAARGAGFFGPELATATAVALGFTGGVANYDHAIWPGPVAHYRGLWGTDVVAYPGYASVDLHNPHTAAIVAHELWEHTRGWKWNAAYRTGAHERWYAVANTAATMMPGPVPEPMIVATEHARARARSIYDLGAGFDALAHTTIRRKVL